MASVKSIENLVAARKSSKTSLEKSKALAIALEKAGPRLEEINQRLPSLEAAVRPIRAQKEGLVAVVGHIDQAVGLAAAILKVFDALQSTLHQREAFPIARGLNAFAWFVS